MLIFDCTRGDAVRVALQEMEANQTNKLIVDRDLAPKFAEIYSFLQLFHSYLDISPVGLADLEEFLDDGRDSDKLVNVYFIL